MDLAIIKNLRLTESTQYVRLLRDIVHRTLVNHRTGFTHGDLQLKNITGLKGSEIMDISNDGIHWMLYPARFEEPTLLMSTTPGEGGKKQKAKKNASNEDRTRDLRISNL
ncbi:hypothetical protein P170DRAFT_475076 [Aspergillus steynii IBT 23096]|uniref:Uncharacterized protein n=1 Tax=Aspergillus steynii IBT 23096 TaxID=1392250 RepID=A0A2I2G774_9EURO|nr:uncharacterized protein P170DRAFT_475076 [Aspergillus steynii IBT 23096]PLB48732.1 hypothetical protein P170DRAFT_475076 [Aspergillus steynii IBT 23096]